MVDDVRVTDAQFRAAVKSLDCMRAEELSVERRRLNAREARGYYVRTVNQRLSLKLVVKKAYDQAGIAWNHLQSRDVYERFKDLNDGFALLHEPKPLNSKELDAEERLELEYVKRLKRDEQPQFRRKLLAADPTCFLTECAAAQALEAAHVLPFAEGGKCKVENGILLRADLHRLFDLGFLAFNPRTGKLSLHPSCLADYSWLLERDPLDRKQRTEWAQALSARWEEFQRRKKKS